MPVNLSQLYGKNFINNQFVESKGGKIYKNLNPFDGSDAGYFADSTNDDMNKAIQCAQNAFDSWSQTAFEHRASLLEALADQVSNNKCDLAKVITTQTGITVANSCREVLYAVEMIKFIAGEARRVNGKMFLAEIDKKMFVSYKPHGVVGIVLTWRHSLALAVISLGSAIAAGCTVVLKPHESTPLSALIIADLIKDVGLPPGVVNVVTASYDSSTGLGHEICTHKFIRHVTFTGSQEVGKKVLNLISPTLKRSSILTKGNTYGIVLESADIADTAKKLIGIKNSSCGQPSYFVNRIFVHEKLYDEFLNSLKSVFVNIKVGPPNDKSTHVSTLHCKSDYDKVTNLVQNMTSQGAKIFYQLEKNQNGGAYYFPPTILTADYKQIKLAETKIYGPLSIIFKYSNDKELFEGIHSLNEGLAAYLYGKDLKQVYKTLDELDVGIVRINDVFDFYTVLSIQGHHTAGVGSFGGSHAIYEYMDTQSVVLNHQ